MEWPKYIGTIILAFASMEGIAWAMHKFVMHGVGWTLHRDHHEPSKKKVERNDFYLFIFAIPSWLLIMFGSMNGMNLLVSIGVGILLYGFCYFIVHDVIIHQRFPYLRRQNNFYIRAIRKAHKIHHKHIDRFDGECFGMLIVPWKYYREALKKPS